ncbi:Rqt4p KNAG_0C01470 [Huiozyma naganishii CBS 8797]|uniref:TRIP4/RQT4 C2HC5-type zinc finger domain-containing protein n=1 Tax=Huiozyma naganishii (strain ATCC MYA-139 / BCRC 22969 / CBS 8797 / KCTC 17520 / NBRC 10181 / NCYC 3082 / Yp74L-3) TaxID=1071383 RepID=J7R351_HUIN7|nr:hypothetical protein KNAG_0C01470 [Kazachstania naganishii CBS 8797]CCK69260.1 hypothetical protein KNAG_0C01470 [Kazachstania naganishii CBS 8797]
MTRKQAIEYALVKIPEILPLEKLEVENLCEQILETNHDPESIAEAFLGILGQDDLPFEFVFKFNEILDLRDDTDAKPDSAATSIPKFEQQEKRKERSETHSKLKSPQSKIEPSQSKPLKSDGKIQSSGRKPVSAKHSEKVTNNGPSKKTKSSKQTKLQSLQEINDALNLLTMNRDKVDATQYKCNCQGNVHPIFSIAPNCLFCGKIVCIKEGLHLNDCAFCGAELIPFKERMELVEALKMEENEINDVSKSETAAKRTGEPKKKPVKTYKISSGMGKNLFAQQDKLFDFIERQKERERKREEVLREKTEEQIMQEATERKEESEKNVDKDLRDAQERLDNLLHFQDTSAQRTKIIDNASDFSMSNESGLWGDARERALMLKKQQRNMRKWENLEKERNGRRDKYVVSMDIKLDGKVVMKEVVKDNNAVYANSDEELENISDEDDARDLMDIKKYKEELSAEKELHNAKLESNIWDYEKDKAQFERPMYVGTSPEPEESNITESNGTERKWKSRIQVIPDDETSLEQNILAAL